ncbi:MAG: hypothetical protein JWM16_299 [Verrucomicrobiales bacterium]|nr:hypothetical protein [Verrucomicrobiales bacterium]
MLCVRRRFNDDRHRSRRDELPAANTVRLVPGHNPGARRQDEMNLGCGAQGNALQLGFRVVLTARSSNSEMASEAGGGNDEIRMNE